MVTSHRYQRLQLLKPLHNNMETKKEKKKKKKKNEKKKKKKKKKQEKKKRTNISNVLALVGLKLYKILENCRPQKDLLSLQNSVYYLATPLFEIAFLHTESSRVVTPSLLPKSRL